MSKQNVTIPGWGDVTSIIASLGGAEKVAELLGVTRPAINHWYHHGIPPRHYGRLMTEARRLRLYAKDGSKRRVGLTYAHLEAASARIKAQAGNAGACSHKQEESSHPPSRVTAGPYCPVADDPVDASA